MDNNSQESLLLRRERKPTGDRRAVILLGTDTPIGLAIIRDLGEHGYPTIGIGRSEKSLARYSRHCHRHVVRAKDEAALIAQIRSLAKEHGASSLMAISESDLMMLNRHRAALESAVTVLAPAADQLASVIDKAVCQDHAEAVGIRAPRTMQFASLAEVRAAADALTYPVVLKWSAPHRVSRTLTEAGLPLHKVEYARHSTELIERMSAYDRAGVFPMVQEYCPGHGLGQMFLARNGDVVFEFQHERLHEWPPEGGTSTLCRSVPLTEHREMRDRARALLKRLNWTGVAMVEFRYDPVRRSYRFMEINGRFWGSLPLATAAGVPFAAGLAALCGGNGAMPALPAEYRRVTACYWIPETRRLFRLLFQRNALQDPFYRPDPIRSLIAYLTLPFRPSTRYFIFRWSDPAPFLADLAGVMAKVRDACLRR